MEKQETKTVTLLKSEYDEMERICKEKKDARIYVCFSLRRLTGFLQTEHIELGSCCSALNNDDKNLVSCEFLSDVKIAVKDSVQIINDVIIADYNKNLSELNELRSELSKSNARFSAIQNKWWFRLFNRS